MDLDKPLLSKFRLRRRIRRIEYEAMHIICFQCGKYGHGRENCSVHSDEQAPMSDKQRVREANQVTKDDPISPEITESYSQWMVASKKVRRIGN